MKICAFCGEEKETSDIVKGKSGMICSECVKSATTYFSELPEEDKKRPIKSLSELKTALDKKVIGQEQAKRQLLVELYKHAKGTQRVKNNAFLIGDSGVGKTHLVRSLADVFNVALVEFDATMFSETGYKGKDVSEIIENAYYACGEDLGELKQAVLFIDEIDKITTTSNSEGVNKVQQSLLKLVEGVTVTIQVKDDRGRRQPMNIDTSQLQFIVAGACVGLKDQIKAKRSPAQTIGFASREQPEHTADMSATADDLIRYGFIPEFMGRFPLIIELNSLTKDDYMRILTESEDSVIKDYISVFHEENIDLEIKTDAVELLAEQIKETSLGFRGVKSTLTRRLNELFYDSVELKRDRIVLDKNNLIKDDNFLNQ